MTVIKSAIAPIQAWLMSQGKCVGCGVVLKNGKQEEFGKGFKKVTCNKCGRIFIYDEKKKTYRRALLEEV